MAQQSLPYTIPDITNNEAWKRTGEMFTDLFSLQSQIISAGDARFADPVLYPTVESKISAARVQAAVELKTIVSIPLVMTPFDPSLVDFTNLAIRNVIEGGNYSVYQPEAYGAKGDDTRNDYANVQTCVNAAAGRGTVVINKKFLCSSMLTLPSNTELTGLGWQCELHFDYVLFSVGEAYIINSGNGGAGNTGIRLRDFTVRGSHPGGPLGSPTPAQCAGLVFRYGSGVEVRSMQILNVPAIAISHQGVDKFVAENNTLRDIGRDGITGGPNGTWPSNDVRIQHNSIQAHDDLIACNQSVSQSSPGTTQPDRWSIVGNICKGGTSLSSDNFSRGLLLSGALDITVSANVFEDSSQSLIFGIADVVTGARCARILVSGNIFKRAGKVGSPSAGSGVGVYFENSADLIISNNIIAQCRDNGLFLKGVVGYTLKGNRVLDNGGSSATTVGLGMRLGGGGVGCTDGQVVGNTVTRSAAGGIYLVGGDRTVIENNYTTDNGQAGASANDTILAGIIVEGTATVGVTVQGNYSTDTQGTKTQSYGIAFRGTPAVVECLNNMVPLNGFGGIVGTVTTLNRRGNRRSTGALTGRTALVNGTVTVNNAEVLAADNISLTRVVGAGTTRGTLAVGTIVAGTSFVINSTDLTGTLSADDDSTIFWEIIH